MTDDEQQRFLTALQMVCDQFNVELTETHRAQCLQFTRYLLEVNTHTNLTRITEPEAVAIKHWGDSLTVFEAVPDLSADATVMDVGTGAGFPGVALKIFRPALRVSLLDSLMKRITFLNVAVTDQGLPEVVALHLRAEDAGHLPAHRDAYDLVTARAVASLPTLLEWCAPLVRPGGKFVAMKTLEVDNEISAAQNAARLLNVRLVNDVAVTLPAAPPDNEPLHRRLLVFEKRKPTPPRFPRTATEIKSKPL
ncbi:MAG: 16S rRNA (guanine(527)-N(7))-methyltransferase RsmG [Armatimonadaceae bacterium]